MPLFAHLTGQTDLAAEQAAHDLQTWLDHLETEEYSLLEEDLSAEPTGLERPMVSKANAVIDRLKTTHQPPAGPPTWNLAVKKRL